MKLKLDSTLIPVSHPRLPAELLTRLLLNNRGKQNNINPDFGIIGECFGICSSLVFLVWWNVPLCIQLSVKALSF